MQWIVLADVHGSVGYLPFIVPELCRADGLFIAGDITEFGGRREAAGVIESFAAVNENILAVAGNCDQESVGKYLDERGMNVHGRVVVQGSLSCVGVSGSLPCPGRTPQEKGEDEFTSILEQAVQSVSAKSGQLVMVSHQPAFGTAVDTLRGSQYCGSHAVRQFIKTYKPILAISGHIHEAAGVDKLGKTTLVNPGPFRAGRYAVVTFNGKHVSVQLKRASD
ncbi:MAG: metallophosphoesterase family protein [Phycisphaerae bacterium]|nr:metallophosphoesterase family protein [Phycisphaerae bacterium]